MRSSLGWRPYVVTALAVIGLGIATYLTLVHYDSSAVALACPLSSVSHGVINCAKVTTSAESTLFGVPVALLGLIYFVVVLGVNLPPMWRPRYERLVPVRIVLACAGMAFVLYLVYSELFLVHAICLWCTGVHLTTFALFVIILTSAGRAVAPSRS